MITYRRAQPGDRAQIERMLIAAGLPTVGVADHMAGFDVAEDGPRAVGTAGLEVYGQTGLLRSVAVDPAYQRHGVAHKLVERTLHRAASAGIRTVYLLTTTAAEYFRRFGFEAVSREAVSPSVQVSAEFGEGCCEEAQAMRLDLNSVRTKLQPATEQGRDSR